MHQKQRRLILKAVLFRKLLKCLFFLLIVMMTGCATIKEIPGMEALTPVVDAFAPVMDSIAKVFFPPQTLTFTVNAPAKYPASEIIRSVQVKPFTILSGRGEHHAVQLKKMIETSVANEGYVKVVNYDFDAVVSGNMNFGDIQKKSYSKSRKTKEGTKYTHYYGKKVTITGNYSLTDRNENRTIIGDSFNFNFEKEWSSYENSDEAEAKALTDEQIIQSALEGIAKEITAAVSPHKETVSRELEKGSDDNIKRGNTYLVNGRTDQAIAIWNQVAEQTEEVKDKAAAYYNIGVVKETEGKYKDAFELFSKANALCPDRELYIKALTRVEEIQQLNDRGKSQIYRLK